jgi:hypothetical protein
MFFYFTKASAETVLQATTIKSTFLSTKNLVFSTANFFIVSGLLVP